MISASDFFKLLTTGLSLVAIRFFWILKPFVLAKPAWSVLTLIVTGTPASIPKGFPWFNFLSKFSAVSFAYLKVSTTIAFIFGLTLSMCLIVSLQISTAETSLFLNNFEIS